VLVAVWMLVWMAVGMGMAVFVLVGMRGFRLYINRRLHGVGCPVRRFCKRFPRGCGRFCNIVPSQVSSQRLVLGERTGFLLYAPQSLPQRYLEQ
jgi:hypothetical protein